MKIKKTSQCLIIASAICIAWASGPTGEAGTLSMGLAGTHWNNNNNNGDGAAWPEGLNGGMTYDQAYQVGLSIGNSVKSRGIKCLRMPITHDLGTGNNWYIYAAPINALSSLGIKVILQFVPCSSCGGGFGDMNNYWAMWDSVNKSFGGSPYVFYELCNEPSATNYRDVYAQFISRYGPSRNKCILDVYLGGGQTLNQALTEWSNLANDARLSSQLLAIHCYHFSGFLTSATGAGNWQHYYNVMNQVIGGSAGRTVITEVGVQTDGNPKNFWQQWNPSADIDVAMLNGVLAWARDNDAGTIQWAGFLDSDLYHWFKSYSDRSEPNTSVCDMFRWAWKERGSVNTGTRRLQNHSDGKYLDGMGRTSNGSAVAQYSSSSSNNQKWNVIQLGSVWFKLQNVATGLYLDSGGHTANGSTCQQWGGGGSWNQQWAFTSTGNGYLQLVNRGTANCLDTGNQTANGAAIQLWGASSSWNQQWMVQ